MKVIRKAKEGKSFPDLNKDGKVTKADILKGRGVIAKSGAALKKQAAVAIAMKKAGKTPKKMQYGGAAASMVSKAKGGAMIKRADGSMSKRGLWDNIRANKGSGKKPTAAMLKQEKKIKAKAKK